LSGFGQRTQLKAKLGYQRVQPLYATANSGEESSSTAMQYDNTDTEEGEDEPQPKVGLRAWVVLAIAMIVRVMV